MFSWKNFVIKIYKLPICTRILRFINLILFKAMLIAYAMNRKGSKTQKKRQTLNDGLLPLAKAFKLLMKYYYDLIYDFLEN